MKEQDIKNASRGNLREPPVNTIPADALGIRELVLALLAIWPSFEWQRLVLDPPKGWLDGCGTTLRQPAQNDEIAPAKWDRGPQ